MKKKALAIVIHGGVGTGHFSQGYSMLEKVIVGLSTTYAITVYSAAEPNEAYKHDCFVVKSPTGVTGFRRWILLSLMLWRDHRKKKYDLLMCFWGYPAGLISASVNMLMKVPLIVYLLGSDSAGIKEIDFGILHKPLVRRAAFWAYRRAQLLLALSHYQVNALLQAGLDRPVHVLPWGADTEMFHRLNKDFAPGVLKVLHVGHLTPVKDQKTLLKVFDIIADEIPAELRIIGVDTMNGAIQALAQASPHAGKISFAEVVPYREMPAQYAWADILIQTSLSEGQSMAVTEAGASGVLIASTSVGLISDLGEEYAICTGKGDYRQLANAILKAVADRKLWQAKVDAMARCSAENTFDQTIANMITQLRSVTR